MCTYSGRTGESLAATCPLQRACNTRRLVEEPWSPVISQNLLDDQAAIRLLISLFWWSDRSRRRRPATTARNLLLIVVVPSKVTKQNICEAKIWPATRKATTPARQDASDGHVSVRANYHIHLIFNGLAKMHEKHDCFFPIVCIVVLVYWYTRCTVRRTNDR